MSTTSPIEWTDRTWNPIRGCTRVSAGCVHCYAERVAYRFSGPGLPYEGLATKRNGHAAWTGQIRYVTEDVALPLRWRKPARIFVNSMSDLFHEGVTDQQLVELFAVMANSPQHTFQVLTKRPERMRGFLGRLRWGVGLGVVDVYGYRSMFARLPYLDDPREYWEPIRHGPPDTGLKTMEGFIAPNIWLGVSVEDQATADARIPLLLQTPAVVRFLSCEPLLGGLDIAKHRPGANRLWLIVGGESGAGARPCWVPWVRSVVRQGQQAGCPVFVKQLGANVRDRNDAGYTGDEPGDWPEIHAAEDRIEHDLDGTRDGYQGAPVRIHLRDRKGGDPAEWPEDLRVREFPAEVPR
jgi:protein gp37